MHWYDRARLAEVRSDRDLSKVTVGQRPPPRRCQCKLLFFVCEWVSEMQNTRTVITNTIFSPSNLSCFLIEIIHLKEKIYEQTEVINQSAVKVNQLFSVCVCV